MPVRLVQQPAQDALPSERQQQGDTSDDRREHERQGDQGAQHRDASRP